MSGETEMYMLKPIVSLPGPLHRGETMYKMRNIHEERRRQSHTVDGRETVPDITEQVTSFLKATSPEYTALEARQEKILAQLAELRKQVSTLCDFVRPAKQAAPVNKCEVQEPVKVNLIINANPKRPPYSILALQRIWEDTEIKIQPCIHSTITGTVPVILKSKSEAARRNVVNLFLIWKDVNDLELVSGLHGYSVTGESNLLRYISRLINVHNYESSTSQNEILAIDSILDWCYCLHFEESSKTKQEMLSMIGNTLDTSWIDKGGPSVADIAAWSTIKQVLPKKVPANLNKWFHTCERMFS